MTASGVRAREVRQMGRMMLMEAGKISVSLRLVSSVSSGTSTIPPPAPNSPVTVPAPKPASAMPRGFSFFIATPPRVLFPWEALLFIGRRGSAAIAAKIFDQLA